MYEYYIYLRKSRADSPLESVEDVLARHETMLQELALKKLGYRIREDHILREVVSGETIIERPKMIELLRIIESDNVKAVLTVEPQRLTRGDLEDCGKVENAFRYSNTRIITLQMEYDLSNKMQRKFFEQELMRGNDYLEYTKEILWRGRVLSAQKGNFIGSIPPYGYEKVNDEIGPTLKVGEFGWVVTKIFDMKFFEHKSLGRIAFYLNSINVKPPRGKKWERSSVSFILQNPHYKGYVRFAYTKTEFSYEDGHLVRKKSTADPEDVVLVRGRHKSLVEEYVYDGVQIMLKNDPRAHIDHAIKNPLAGLVYCSECGRSMTRHPYHGNKKDRIECRTKGCGGKSAYLYETIKNVSNSLESISIELKARTNSSDSDDDSIYAKQIQRMEDELQSMAEQEKKQYDLLEKGIYSEEVFLERNSSIRAEMNDLSQKIDALKKNRPKRINYNDQVIRLRAAVDGLRNDDLSAEEKNILLKNAVKRIDYIFLGRKEKPSYALDIELLI